MAKQEPAPLAPRRIRWRVAGFAVLLSAALVYLLLIDPWLAQRDSRAQMRTLVTEMREMVATYEQCTLGGMAPAEKALPSWHRAFLTGDYPRRYQECAEALRAGSNALRTKLKSASHRLARQLHGALAESDTSVLHPTFIAILQQHCRNSSDLRRAHDQAASALGMPPFDPMFQPGRSDARCSDLDMETLAQHRVELEDGRDPERFRSWVDNNTLYRFATYSHADYGDLDSERRLYAVEAERRPARGAVTTRILDNAWEAGWVGDDLWGLGNTIEDPRTRVFLQEGDELVVGKVLLSARDREQHFLSGGSRASQLLVDLQATAAGHSFIADENRGALHGIRIAEGGRGAATITRFAPARTPDADSWLRITPSGTIIALRAVVSGDQLSLVSHRLSATGSPTEEELKIGSAQTSALLPCSSGVHNWALIGDRVLHSNAEAETWKPIATLSAPDTDPQSTFPLAMARVACGEDGLFVVGSDTSGVARWSRCTIGGCSTLASFAFARSFGDGGAQFMMPAIAFADGAGRLLLPLATQGATAVFGFQNDGELPSFSRLLKGTPGPQLNYWLVDEIYVSDEAQNGYRWWR